MWVHLGIVAVTVAACARAGLPGGGARWTVGLPALAMLVPIGIVAVRGAEEQAWTGTEGGLEAVTLGVLAALVGAAVRAREPWVGVAAAVLLLEEIDYGQLFAGFATPAWVLGLESRSDRLNFHNLTATDWLWKPVPAVAILACAVGWGRWEPLRERLRVPRFGLRAWPAAGGLVATGVAASQALDARRFGEALELALVLWAIAAWEPRRSEPA